MGLVLYPKCEFRVRVAGAKGRRAANSDSVVCNKFTPKVREKITCIGRRNLVDTIYVEKTRVGAKVRAQEREEWRLPDLVWKLETGPAGALSSPLQHQTVPTLKATKVLANARNYMTAFKRL